MPGWGGTTSFCIIIITLISDVIPAACAIDQYMFQACLLFGLSNAYRFPVADVSLHCPNE